MKREIKFRMWNNNQMVYPPNGLSSNLGPYISLHGLYYIDGVYQKDMVLLQFTGLYDQNGNEIYEGDIVEFKKKSGFGTRNGDKKVVVWDTAHLCFIMVWLQYFEVGVEYRNGNPITKTTGGYTHDKVTDSKKVEVIGNIFENKELLK